MNNNKNKGFAVFKLKSRSVKVVIGAFALFLLFNALTGLGILDLPDINMAILSLASVSLIFIEVGMVRVFGGTKGGKKGLDLLSAFGVIAALLLLVITVLDLISANWPILDGIRGIIFTVVFVSFAIETFIR